MHILVLNGSPKGKYSVTLQTILYLQKLHPEHAFEIMNVGQSIKSLEKDFAPAQAALKKAEKSAAPKKKKLKRKKSPKLKLFRKQKKKPSSTQKTIRISLGKNGKCKIISNIFRKD